MHHNTLSSFNRIRYCPSRKGNYIMIAKDLMLDSLALKYGVEELSDRIQRDFGQISDHLKMLEKHIEILGDENKKLKDELNAVKHNRRITEMWARGEVEN